MKWSYWIESFLMFTSFILMQTTTKSQDINFYAYEDSSEEQNELPKNLTLEERFVLIAHHFTKCLNNIILFLKSVSILFKNIFIDNDVTSIHNLSTLSDIYEYGSLAEEHIYEIIYCIIGHPDPENYYSYTQ